MNKYLATFTFAVVVCLNLLTSDGFAKQITEATGSGSAKTAIAIQLICPQGVSLSAREWRTVDIKVEGFDADGQLLEKAGGVSGQGFVSKTGIIETKVDLPLLAEKQGSLFISVDSHEGIASNNVHPFPYQPLEKHFCPVHFI